MQLSVSECFGRATEQNKANLPAKAIQRYDWTPFTSLSHPKLTGMESAKFTNSEQNNLQDNLDTNCVLIGQKPMGLWAGKLIEDCLHF